jgi:Flp pilus assembly protein TadD
MYSRVKNIEPAGDNSGIKEISREIDKIWKFQTKGVSEIVESLADSEKKHASNLGDLKQEFARKLEDLAGAMTKSSLQPVQNEVQMLREKLEGSQEGFDNLSTTVSDFVTSLEENLKEIKTLSNSLFRQMTDIKSSIPQEKSIAEAVRGSLEGAADARKGVEEKLVSLKDELAGKIGEISARQEAWEKRFEEFANRQNEISQYLEAGKKHRENEQGRQSKKESRKYNNLGVTSFHNGAYDMARDQFIQAVKLDPEFAEAYNNLGLAHTELNEEEKATEAFTKAVELNPSLHAAYNNLGYVLYKQGNYEQAIEMYNEALGRSMHNAPAYTNLGNAYYKLGRNEDARAAWTKALELDPGNEKAKRNLKKLGDKPK